MKKIENEDNLKTKKSLKDPRIFKLNPFHKFNVPSTNYKTWLLDKF